MKKQSKISKYLTKVVKPHTNGVSKATIKQGIATMAVASNVIDTVNTLKKKATPIVNKLGGIDIGSKQEYEVAAKSVATLKEYRSEAEILQKGITDPANTIIKNAKALFKPFLDLVDQTEKNTKTAMLLFLERQEKASDKLLSKFETGSIKKLSTVVAKQNELLDTSSNYASTRDIQVLVIYDLKKVPRQYLVPDEAKIKQALKDEIKVAGCRMDTKKSIAI